MISHVLNAGLGALVLLLVFAVSMGLAAGWCSATSRRNFGALVEAGLVQLPAIMLIGGVVVALTALLPRCGRPALVDGVMLSILLGPLFGAATLQLPAVGAGHLAVHPHPEGAGRRLTAVPVFSLIAISAAPRRGGPGGIPPPQPCPPNVREGDPRRRT